MGKRAMAATALIALAGCGDPAERRTAEPPSGQRLFSECAICHTTAPPDTPAGKIRLIGPNLFAIYGAPSARLEGFAYSKAMRDANLVWDEVALDAYIANPKAFIPGNRMAYPGQPDAAKRAAIVEYLKTLQ